MTEDGHPGKGQISCNWCCGKLRVDKCDIREKFTGVKIPVFSPVVIKNGYKTICFKSGSRCGGYGNKGDFILWGNLCCSLGNRREGDRERNVVMSLGDADKNNAWP